MGDPHPTELKGGRYAVIHEPVAQDVYRTHVDEAIRVTFERGVVAGVDQQRRR